MESSNELIANIVKYPATPIDELMAIGVTDAMIVANIITVVLAILTHLPVSVSSIYNHTTSPYDRPNIDVNRIINTFSNVL